MTKKYKDSLIHSNIHSIINPLMRRQHAALHVTGSDNSKAKRRLSQPPHYLLSVYESNRPTTITITTKTATLTHRDARENDATVGLCKTLPSRTTIEKWMCWGGVDNTLGSVAMSIEQTPHCVQPLLQSPEGVRGLFYNHILPLWMSSIERHRVAELHDSDIMKY